MGLPHAQLLGAAATLTKNLGPSAPPFTKWMEHSLGDQTVAAKLIDKVLSVPKSESEKCNCLEYYFAPPPKKRDRMPLGLPSQAV